MCNGVVFTKFHSPIGHEIESAHKRKHLIQKEKRRKAKMKPPVVFFPSNDSSDNKVAGVYSEIGERARVGWCVHVVGTELTEMLHMSFEDKWTSSCVDTA